MAIIKAKYNNLVRPYMRTEKQGFGSLYGGNQISDVSNSERLDNIVNSSTGNMFVGNRLFSYTNLNTGKQLVFTNDSVFIVDNSNSSITEIDTQVALQFINESDWVKDVEAPIENLLLNGNFDDDSVWFNQDESAWSIANGKATYLPNGARFIRQDFNFELGKRYKVEIGIVDDFTTSYRMEVRVSSTDVISSEFSSETSRAAEFEGSNQQFIRIKGFSSGGQFSIDNVSIIEV